MSDSSKSTVGNNEKGVNASASNTSTANNGECKFKYEGAAERRGNYPRPERDLYALPNIDTEIKSERRVDELDRLREVREQKKTWLKTVLFCAFLNVILLCLAIYGGIK